MTSNQNTFDLHPASFAAMALVFIGPLLLLTVTQQSLYYAAALYINVAALSFYDFKEFRLPNILNASFLLLATTISYREGIYPFEYHLIGAIAGFLVLFILNLAYQKIRGSDGMGMGDAKLLAGAGMLVGWPNIPIILSIASILGLGYAFIRFGNSKVNLAVTHIPFGPFLGFATITLWLCI